MKKKIICLLLAVMTAGVLGGCGEKAPAAETSQTVESAAETSSAAAQSSETVTVQEDCSKEVYEAFLQGTEKLYTDNYEGTRYDFQGNEVVYYPENSGYNLDEFLKATLEIESDVCTEQYIQQVGYQFIDCGADGIPELLLFVGVQTDEFYYSERQYVCKAVDGKLQLTYQAESNSYVQESVTSDTGAVANIAMYGYSYWYESHGYLNAEGQYHQVSNVLVSIENPASYILDSRFTEAINDDFGEYDEVYVRAYSIGEAASEEIYDSAAVTYYCGEKEEDEASNGIDFKANMELLQKAFDKTGVKLYTMAEIQALLADRVKAIGAEAAEKNGKAISYTFLDLKDAWTEVVTGGNSDSGEGNWADLYDMLTVADYEYKPGNYPNLTEKSTMAEKDISEVEDRIDAKLGTEFMEIYSVVSDYSTQYICDVPNFGMQVIETYVQAGDPLMDAVMKAVGYTDYSIFYEYNFGLSDPYYSGLNTPVSATLNVNGSTYTYSFWNGELLVRTADGKRTTNPQANDFLNNIYKLGWYYGEVLNGEIRPDDTVSLTIYSPGDQIWVDGDTIYFYSEAAISEFTEIYELDGDTCFYDEDVTAFFEGYQAGDTPMKWVLRMLDQQEEYPTALTGVFEFTVDGRHIDSLNGCYWWD